MELLAINWGSVGLKVAQLILSLSILVILHEFGHYITARWFKCRVEKFYLFFDPWFSLVKKKIGETVYGIGWLPLGGYVKIAGMIDESMDKETMKLPPQPWEFRSKPAWQRLIIMLGGVTVNILLAFVIYAAILMVWGEKKIYNNSLKYGIAVEDSLIKSFGFKDGDKIISMDGQPVENFNNVIAELIVSDSVTLEREGKTATIQLPKSLIGKLVEKKRSDVPLIGIRYPFWIGGADKGSPASKLGLQRWDKVVMIDSTPVEFVNDVARVIEKKKNSSITVTLQRGTEQFTSVWTVDSAGALPKGMKMIGKPESLDTAGIFKYTVIRYGFFEAFPAGVVLASEKLGWYIDQFKKILTPSTGAYKGVGGFKAMGSVFSGDEWDWEHFWNITAFFSIVLAFMNLLPIPALDGGHVLFTLIEMITKRKPSEKFLEYAQIAGMVILLALMLYANGNDWFGWGRGK
ncbi:MAG TPA: RIP metalloprotease RseP [Ferruginibacter sp.]|nr:RIP metalloprotease RseP [Chitinophagaceae bacterium]HRI23764.1 RIP metalloprotease RseP [Ferruginibacter sp.]